jgi:hypothetical protein
MGVEVYPWQPTTGRAVLHFFCTMQVAQHCFCCAVLLLVMLVLLLLSAAVS